MSSIELRESSATLTNVGARRWKAVLITPGQGSSGLYSEEMLKQYGPAAFPKGSHSYVDHPGEGEQRSPKNLFGVLAETAHYEENVGLVAELDIMPHWADFAEAVAPYVGLSIFAAGTASKAEDGTVVIESLEHNITNSIDLVSYAGRGGSLAERLYESAIHSNAPIIVNNTIVDGGSNSGIVLEETSVNSAETSGTVITESRNTTKENTVEITELGEKVDKIAEGLAALTAVLTPLAESLTAAEPVVEEKEEIDFARVAEAAIDAGLPAAARKAVYEKVRLTGTKVEDVIAEQKALVDDMRKQVAEAAGLQAIRVGGESANQDWTVARWKGNA